MRPFSPTNYRFRPRMTPIPLIGKSGSKGCSQPPSAARPQVPPNRTTDRVRLQRLVRPTWCDSQARPVGVLDAILNDWQASAQGFYSDLGKG